MNSLLQGVLDKLCDDTTYGIDSNVTSLPGQTHTPQRVF